MSAVLFIFRQYMYNNLRDKISLFWHILFPVLLLIILNLVFSGVNEGSIQFAVTLVDEDTTSQSEMMNVTEIFKETLLEESRQDSWLRLYLPEEDQDLDEYLASGLRALTHREIHLLLHIPPGFNQTIMEGIGRQMMGVPGPVEKAQLDIYSRAHHQSSQIAASIFETIVEEMNREINLELGFLTQEDLIPARSVMVDAASGSTFSYHDYIVPGVILMGFIMTGLFLCFSSILTYRDQGVLRRYLVTPLTTIQYFLGLILWIVLLSLIQVLLVYSVGHLFFQVSLQFLSFKVFLYYIFALMVVISLGFLVASLAKSAESGDALANLILYPMMFLGGLFFPVEHVPPIIQIFIRINPATYLVNGIRDVMGVYPSFTPTYMNLLVPALWLLFSILFSLKFFSWEVS